MEENPLVALPLKRGEFRLFHPISRHGGNLLFPAILYKKLQIINRNRDVTSSPNHGLAYNFAVPRRDPEWVNSYGSQAAMREILRQEGMAKGLDLGVKYTNTGVGGVSVDDPLDKYFRGSIGAKQRAEGIQELGMRFKGAGGDIMGRNSAIVKKTNENMKVAADALVKSEATLTGIRNNQAPAPVQVAAPGGANNGRAR